MKITSKYNAKCTTCGGYIQAGQECDWERGAGVRHIGTCPPPQPKQDRAVTVTMGVFRKDGRIYVVKPNKDKTRVYAKEIIASPPRMTESGEVVDFEAVYRPGAVFDLAESDRWDLAEASDFLTKFARCIVCNRHLKAAKSVAAAIGPVCAKYFAGHHHHGNGAQAPAPKVEKPKRGRLTIERQHGETYSHNTFAIYEHGVYPRSSVLAGRPSRKFVDGGFETVEAAKAAYPEAVESGSTFIPAAEITRHLPDDADDDWFTREGEADRYENDIIYGDA